MSSPFPTITVVSRGSTPRSSEPISLGQPPEKLTSYLIRLFPQLNENDGTSLTVGEGEITPDSIDGDLLAAFHYEPDGAIYLENYHESKSAYTVLLACPGIIRTRLRTSTPGKERFYAIIDQDMIVEFDGVEGSLRFIYNNNEISSRQKAARFPPVHGNEFRPPQIQVMHSLPHHADSYGDGNGIVGGTLPGLMETSTPIVTQTNDTRKVYETPAVKSRHVDPNSSPRRRPQESPTKANSNENIQFSKTGLMVTGVPENSEDFSATDSEDESVVQSSFFVPTAPMMDIDERDGIDATPGNEIPSRNRSALPTADVGTSSGVATPSEKHHSPATPPQKSSIVTGRSPQVVIDNEDLDLDEAKNPEHERLPESLPEAFRYAEEKKLKTPVRMYGKRGKRLAEKRKVEQIQTRRGSTEETQDSSEPLTAAQKKGRGMKRKVREDDEGSSPKIRDDVTKKKQKGKGGSAVSSVAGEGNEEAATPTATKKGRGRKKAEEAVPPSTEDAALFSTAPEGSPVVSGDKPRRGVRNAPVTNEKENTKTAKEIRKPATQQFDTQYTFVGTEEGEDSDAPIPASKTPKPRDKATVKKTPATTKSTTRKKPTTHSMISLEASSSPADSLPASNLRTTNHYDGSPPRISFTNSTLPDNKQVIRFLRANGAKTTASPADPPCNFLIVGPGELKRTPKFIIAVARGIRIVEEQWMRDSNTAGYWVDPAPYTPYDPEREQEWGFKLSDALERGRGGECQVLEGKAVYLTPSLLSHLKSLKSEDGLMGMLKAAGAEQVIKKAPRGEVEEDTLVLGKDEGDKDVTILEKGGWKVFGTGVVGTSVLRGALQEGEEFLVKAGESNVPEKKRRGGKKPTQ